MMTINNKEPLRVMAIDIGTKYSAIFFNDYNAPIFKGGKYTQSLVSDNYQEHTAFFFNWIRRLKPNLIIYERMLDGVEKIRDREHLWNLWKIFRTIISYCQKSKIEGIPIAPNELKHYRNFLCYGYDDKEWKCPWKKHEKGYKYINGTSWILLKNLNCNVKDLPNNWKEQAKEEGFEWIGEEACNELDAQCLWEYWQWFDMIGDTSWIEARKQLHWQELEKEIRPVINRSKTERRFEDNYSLSQNDQGSKINGEQFKQVDTITPKPQQTTQWGEQKVRLECPECGNSFTRLPKYVSKNKPALCFDCMNKKRNKK